MTQAQQKRWTDVKGGPNFNDTWQRTHKINFECCFSTTLNLNKIFKFRQHFLLWTSEKLISRAFFNHADRQTANFDEIINGCICCQFRICSSNFDLSMHATRNNATQSTPISQNTSSRTKLFWTLFTFFLTYCQTSVRQQGKPTFLPN